MKADLHCHSVYSDGSENVENIIMQARALGIDYLALTDHDTLAGIEPAKREANRCGINLIPAVECSCLDKERGRSVHVLCYNPKDPMTLQRFLNVTLQSRYNQKLKIIEKVREKYPVELDEVLALKGLSQSIYECHIMQVLAKKGYTNTVCGIMMRELLSSKGSCYVKTDYADVRETVRVIRDCGGVVVLAHPQEYDSFDLFRELTNKGLIDGVEVFHPRNSIGFRQQLLEIAIDKDLIITGGSDFHGSFSFNPHPLGYCTTDIHSLNRILNYKR